MSEQTPRRRLAAILAADVVGYSRLMGKDEAGTLAALKARRKEVLEPLVALHRGRVFKIAGDGVLVEFASAVHAVQCAIDLQQGMSATNAELPAERRIVLRIGVNLGDVMVEGSDLYGDGVNIAARLEGIADPGGILVSGSGTARFNPTGQAVDRRAAVREPECRSRAGLFRRRPDRRPDHRFVEGSQPLRHRPELVLRLQGQSD